MRWLIPLLLFAVPALAASPGVELVEQRTELTSTYRTPDGLWATTSSGSPVHWWDGHVWRDPDPTWREDWLVGIPGPLIWHRDAGQVRALARTDSRLVAAVSWDGAIVDHAFHFDWQGLPCTLTPNAHGQKLACTVAKRIGDQILHVPVDGVVTLTPDGGATVGELWKWDKLTVIGANGTAYPGVVSAWRQDVGGLSVTVNDRALPASAFPYVIDPNTGTPTFPGTCATATGVGTVAWSTPTNAQTSNNAHATASLALNAQSNWLKCTNFGFTTTPLADTKVIKGIVATAEVQRGGNGATIAIFDIRAVKADGSISTTNRASGNGTGCTLAWTATDTTRTCGGSLDTWGEAFTPADIRDIDFGIVLSAKNTGNTTRNAMVDAISVTIYYSPPAGRVFITGWDSFTAETGTNEGVATGAPVRSAAAARTGTGGLRLTSTGSAGSGAISYATPSAVDGDLTDRAFGRWYWSTTPTMPVNTAIVAGYIAQDSEVGCYALLQKDRSGCFGYQVLYHGKETTDLNFGSFPVTSNAAVNCATTMTGHAIGLGQILTGSTVACPLYVDGVLAQDYNLTLNQPESCVGGACDIAAVVIGTPATGAVDGYNSFPAFTLDVDDFVVDNLLAPGVGRVMSLFPGTDTGATLGWTNTCPTNAFDCLTDWATGVEDTCFNSNNTRQKSGGTNLTDLFDLATLSPALAASESVGSIRGMAACCVTSGTDGFELHMKSGTTDQLGPEVTVSTTAATRFSLTLSSNFIVGEPAWTESTVNSLLLGYDRSTVGTGNARCSAEMLYVDVTTPVADPDQNLQDVNGDGKIVIVTGCDSFTAGTRSSLCTSDNGACTAPCATDGECDGGSCNLATGHCEMFCEVTQDCTCGDVAICPTANNWVNQFSLKVPQIDELVNCGRNVMPSQWWASVLPTLIADPYSHAPPCRLVRGAWGNCSATTSQTCTLDADCPVSQTCIRNPADYVIDMCGGNEIVGYEPGDCTVNAFFSGLLVPSINDRWYRQSCPLAATSPAAFQATRHSCTTDGDCNAFYATGESRCQHFCTGHSDPVWPCQFDDQCGECNSDATRSCFHTGICVDSTGAEIKVLDAGLFSHFEVCNVDADCVEVGSSCVAYETNFGAWGDPFGTCGTCTHNTCNTGTKYCTVPCSGLSCSTDADCGPGYPTATMGGTCNIGTGKCTNCGSGGQFNYKANAAAGLVNDRRIASSPGQFQQAAYRDRQASILASIQSAGAHRLQVQYGATFVNKPEEIGMRERIRNMELTDLAFAPVVVDLYNAADYFDDRTGDNSARPYGSLASVDGAHPQPAGAQLSGRLIAATANLLYPVCSNDITDVCGFCDVACTTDTQANPPVVAGNTPTPVTNACRTATPGVKVAGCTTNANCGAGCTCEDVQPGAGVDNRCVCEDMTQCPVGDATRARKRSATNALCAGGGTCTLEKAPPMCTVQKTRCTVTSDCTGFLLGDVCAVDGVWQSCTVNADCTRAGGHYAHPVCAMGTPGPTPTGRQPQRVCQQPTPTP